MTKNATRYCFTTIIIVFGLQFIACQSMGKPPLETAPQLPPRATTQQSSQTSGVLAEVETALVATSTDTATETIILEPTVTPVIAPLPSITPTLTPFVTPTFTPEPYWAFQLAFVVWSEEENVHGLWMYSSETQESTLLVPAKPDTYIGPIIQLRPDKTAIGYTVAEADGTWAIWVAEIATGETTQLTPFFSSSEYHGFLEGWSPDQQWLYIRLRDTTVLQEEHHISFNLDTQESIEVSDFALAWSPVTPNRYISAGKENETHTLKVVDIGSTPLTFESPKQQLPAVARWEPNGQRIVIGLGGGFNKPTSFFMLDLEAKQIQSILDGNMRVTSWSPDGKWIAFDDDVSLIFFDSQELMAVRVSEPDFEQITPVNWLNSTTFLFKMARNLYAANPKQPESIVELIQLDELYPNLDPFTNIIAWTP